MRRAWCVLRVKKVGPGFVVFWAPDRSLGSAPARRKAGKPATRMAGKLRYEGKFVELGKNF